MTANEVAAVLKISRRTLERWDKDGKLPAIRVGGAVRYRPADVRALIEGEGAA